MSELTNSHIAGGIGPGQDPAEVGEELLRVEDLKKHFVSSGLLAARRQRIRAVDGVSFNLRQGETLGVVGESGCGKSTLARMLVRLVEPTSGRILLRGRDITNMPRQELRRVHRQVRMVFQNPHASLNPRMSVRQILKEPLRGHPDFEGLAAERRVRELLDHVGLARAHLQRFPSEFSGGQRQRIAIARALATNPEIVILDEPVSSLDVSIQAQIVTLLQTLQRELGLSYIFVAHDLAVVRYISHRVAVMYLGKVAEVGIREQVFERPTHPYTCSLLSAMPIEEPSERGLRERILLEGDLPSPANPPSGCRFRTRCYKAEARCEEEEPALVDRVGDGRLTACHFPEWTSELSTRGTG